MVSSEIGLGEIVVVGYGTQRKESVTGSVASMKGDEMRDVPSSNITQALAGTYIRGGYVANLIQTGRHNANPYSWYAFTECQ